MSKKKITKPKNKLSKKKPKNKISSKKKNSCDREKVYGEPMLVKPLRPVSEHYNLETGEIYPKIFFKESLWVRFKRFLGLVP